MDEMETLQDALRFVRERTGFQPQAAVILGSGLGGYASQMKIEMAIPYRDIPGFPVSTVAGHNGQLLLGYVGNTPVVAMQGRVHYYEGYDVTEVVRPVRLMGLMGAKVLLLTNAAGGINLSFHPGDLMLITDQISSLMPNPLRGKNLDELGPRFPDMSVVYDKELQAVIRKAAETCGVPLQEGVYLQTPGPSYESPAEIRMFRSWGADAVGMSTVVEAIAARHMGMRVAGISCITNMAAGILDQPLCHEEVQATAAKVETAFTALVNEILTKITEG